MHGEQVTRPQTADHLLLSHLLLVTVTAAPADTVWSRNAPGFGAGCLKALCRLARGLSGHNH